MNQKQQALALRLILTDRQLEVCRCIWEGLCHKETAARLGISRKTVESHVAVISCLLGTRSNVRLALMCEPLFREDGSYPEEWDRLPREARERYHWQLLHMSADTWKRLGASRVQPAALTDDGPAALRAAAS